MIRVAPGLIEPRGLEFDWLCSCGQIGRECGNAVRQRAHEELVRGRIAKELHADVAVALEILWEHEPLHRAGRRRLEPLIVEDALAFDRDETGADVGRADTHFNRVAAAVGWFIELNLELGVALERPREVGLAGHGVTQLVQLGARRVAQDHHEVAWLGGWQRKKTAARGDIHWT